MRKILFVLTIALAIGTQLFATVTATWDWQHSIPTSVASVSYQYTTGSVLSNVSGVSMFVDATSGKLYANGDNAQFNAGTKLHIPVVSTIDVVTFIAHPSGYAGVIIGGNDYDNSTTTRVHTPTVAEVTQGYVEIISKGGYMYSVSVDLAYKPATKTIAQWDWKNNKPTEIDAVHIECNTGSVDSDVAGISMFVDATSGKLKANGDNAQFNQGTKLRVPVTSTTDVVKVLLYPGTTYDVSVGGTNYSTQSIEYTATASDISQGYVEIIQGESSMAYIYYVILEKGNYTLLTIGATGWCTFSDARNIIDFTDLNGVVEAYTVIGHSGNAITKSDVDATAPINTGLLLNAVAGTYALPFATSSSTDVSANLLKPGTGEAVSAEVDKTKYVLAASGEPAVATFLRIDGTPATVPVGKAYLEFNEEISLAPASLRIVDEESGATNIEKVESAEEVVKYFENGKLLIMRAGIVYDALGRVVR